VIQKTARERLLASTIVGGVFSLALAASPAWAQQATEQAPPSGPVEASEGQIQTDAEGRSVQDADVEEVVVTGSRIRRTNLVTASPVTQVTGEDIDIQGVTRVEDLVNELPQAFAAQGANISNGASGTATVDLRGLGSDRTLVLIDGRRLPFGSPLDTAADLNQIRRSCRGADGRRLGHLRLRRRGRRGELHLQARFRRRPAGPSGRLLPA
jgi:outer membrane cobalamin receptor